MKALDKRVPWDDWKAAKYQPQNLNNPNDAQMRFA